MTGPIFDPEQATLFISQRIVLRTGFRLPEDQQDALLGLMQAAYDRLEQEEQLPRFFDRVVVLAGALGEVLPHDLDWEERITRSHGPFAWGGKSLPPEALPEAFRSICPLWPFCT